MSNTVPTPTKLTPEAVIEQLRAMATQIDDVAPLTADQRALLKARIRMQKPPIVEASINVIGVMENVSQAIGQPLDGVRLMQTDAIRWEAAAEQARAFLKSLESSNLVRRERLALIGTQAYTIGTTLAKDPANAALVPHVEEVKRLKVASRRKKAPAPHGPQTPTTPTAPTPATPATPAPSTTTPKA